MPVRITMAPVRAAMPPSSEETSMLMAVVTDLGSIVMYCSCSSRSTSDRSRTLKRLTRVPAAMPAMMAAMFFFRSSSFS